ncbi:ribosome biogenesis/translation initiation ATPase RLI [Candidatus Woesearchaeota archaeon]|nr:ribosome biogenesis/translation initiation ATPase RLI [Candidatus Woesearchaeota archaeon]
MPRIAIVDNTKLKSMEQKLEIQRICPVNKTGKECIKIEVDKRLTIDENLCTGCGLCVKPGHGAIQIINLPEEWDKQPIHRYGENAFALYSLPCPSFGKVVGLLGINGIGKSTAIKILAKIDTPNLGNYKEKGSFDLLINYFKGTEAQTFFKDLKEGKIKIGYKPQQVELIPKTTKGKVGELLRKVDERKKFSEVVEKLELNNFLDRELTQLSGGELQRVAIAATALRKANVYIFDEPTSYLDIKQRISVSEFMKNLVDEKTGVLLVEHDLIILDYMTDIIHIMYGSAGAYGVVSKPKPSKNGINTFLSGYIRDENMRFRPYEIKFLPRQPFAQKTSIELVCWDDITKDLGGFKLKVNKGKLHKHRIIGVLGENGIGKTTFVKILAGQLKSDKGAINEELKISYKPQYLEIKEDEPVEIFLAEAIAKYENQLIVPLQLEQTFKKMLSQLSGGELQRVMVAKCLSQDAKLYLLDEPSAYLDIEQRLALSKIMRNFIEQRGASILVVDHDLLFIDYISDELLIFEGTPAKEGEAHGPYDMKEGMNKFLSKMKITLRKDQETFRPRINKPNSVLDREQKRNGEYYYAN